MCPPRFSHRVNLGTLGPEGRGEAAPRPYNRQTVSFPRNAGLLSPIDAGGTTPGLPGL